MGFMGVVYAYNIKSIKFKETSYIFEYNSYWM